MSTPLPYRIERLNMSVFSISQSTNYPSQTGPIFLRFIAPDSYRRCEPAKIEVTCHCPDANDATAFYSEE